MSPIDLWLRLRRRRAGIRPGQKAPSCRDWTYRPSRIGYYTRYLRLSALRRRRSFPVSAMLLAPYPADGWCLYFMYLPEGRLSSAHRYTIDRLRANGRRVLAIVSSPDIGDAGDIQRGTAADAVMWKALDGFDFSAYALGVEAIARYSPGSSLLVMNDSVLGPFGDFEAMLDGARWDLTGFIGSIRVENHIQSFAFYLKRVTTQTVAALRSVLSLRHAYDNHVDVIYCQETRFARIASRRMSVGSLWYSDDPMGDPSHDSALSLVAEGYPFVKRKLLLEHRELYPDGGIEAFLEMHDHPLPDADWRD